MSRRKPVTWGFDAFLCVAVAMILGCARQVEVSEQKTAEGLPMQREFPVRSRLTVYPPGPGARAVPIEGRGTWTLRFEPTEDPHLISVRLMDARITLEPFRIDYDADGDGRSDPVQVGPIQLDRGAFDLDASGGMLNRETGEFSMTVAHHLTPATVPLLEELGIGPLRFSFTERGNMDLAAGIFTTYARRFSLPEPLQDIKVGAGENPCCPEKPNLIVLPQFICEKQCVPGGNVVEFYATVQHFQEGKACKPVKFNTELRNNTENQKLISVPQNQWTYSPTGVYQLKGVTAAVDTDVTKKKLPNDPKTTFEMTSFTPDCDPAVRIKQVTVLSKPRRLYLCTASADEHGKLSGSWAAQLSVKKGGGPLSSGVFGKGIVIAHVENPSTNPYAVLVEYGGASDTLSPGGSPSGVFLGKPPGYGWKLDIPHGTPDFADYQSNPKDFCLEVWLDRKCTPG
jgi:hypothetical protein